MLRRDVHCLVGCNANGSVVVVNGNTCNVGNVCVFRLSDCETTTFVVKISSRVHDRTSLEIQKNW